MTKRYEPIDSPDGTALFEYHDLTPPTIEDVYAARRIVDRYLPRTPLVRSEALSAEFDADVYLKREDTLPTGVFKVRGGITLASSLDEKFREQGLIAAAVGYHSLSVAYAGHAFDVPVIVGVAMHAHPTSVATMERFGARVEFHGSDLDDVREWVEHQAVEEGYRYVHPANEPTVVAGVATAGLEVVEDRPDVDLLFTPIMDGSNAAGYCLTVGELTNAEVIGVQWEEGDEIYRTYHEDLDPEERLETFAEASDTYVPYALTNEILREHLDDMMVVTQNEIRKCIYDVLVEDHIVLDWNSSQAIAAMHRLRTRITGKTVVVPLSARNLALYQLRSIIDEYGPL